jgi:drug/metabolite transporter (DMT)-like permease
MPHGAPAAAAIADRAGGLIRLATLLPPARSDLALSPANGHIAAAAGAPAPGTAGIPYALAATAVLVTLDALGKLLSERLPVVQVSWARFVFSMALILPAFLLTARGRAAIVTPSWPRQILRSALLAGVTFLFFLGVSLLPLPTVTALMFATPLLVVMLSIPVLGERVGPRRWLGVAAGWVGVAIVLKPGFGFEPVLLLPLACALVNALFHLATRRLSTTEPPLATFFYTGVVGTVAFSVLVPFHWTAPTAAEWLLMAAAGGCGALGHWLLLAAYRRSEASLLAPFSYLSIVWSTLAAALLWRAVPDAATYAGAGLIVAAGLYIWHRERVPARRTPA